MSFKRTNWQACQITTKTSYLPHRSYGESRGEGKLSMTKKIGAVAVVGGTHGNELTGIYTVKHWQKNNLRESYPEFQIEYLLANKTAINENKRYIEQDLNRCFQLTDIQDKNKINQEQKLAKQINQKLGPKGNARVDFIIDLHTSTANMQTNIVLIKMDDFHLKLAAYIKLQIPDAIITSESQLMDDHHFLCSVADKGVVIEIGPVVQGVLDSVCFDKTNVALKTCLDFVNLYNQKNIPELNPQLEVMSYHSKLYFPCDQFEDINAVVHPSLVGKDYSKIQKGTPIFKTFFGENVFYDGQETHIAFVNEAAYYDQKIAMCFCNPVQYSLTNLKPVELTKL